MKISKKIILLILLTPAFLISCVQTDSLTYTYEDKPLPVYKKVKPVYVYKKPSKKITHVYYKKPVAPKVVAHRYHYDHLKQQQREIDRLKREREAQARRVVADNLRYQREQAARRKQQERLNRQKEAQAIALAKRNSLITYQREQAKRQREAKAKRIAANKVKYQREQAARRKQQERLNRQREQAARRKQQELLRKKEANAIALAKRRSIYSYQREQAKREREAKARRVAANKAKYQRRAA